MSVLATGNMGGWQKEDAAPMSRNASTHEGISHVCAPFCACVTRPGTPQLAPLAAGQLLTRCGPRGTPGRWGEWEGSSLPATVPA
jgi:hypothetical protein